MSCGEQDTGEPQDTGYRCPWGAGGPCSTALTQGSCAGGVRGKTTTCLQELPPFLWVSMGTSMCWSRMPWEEQWDSLTASKSLGPKLLFPALLGQYSRKV